MTRRREIKTKKKIRSSPARGNAKARWENREKCLEKERPDAKNQGTRKKMKGQLVQGQAWVPPTLPTVTPAVKGSQQFLQAVHVKAFFHISSTRQLVLVLRTSGAMTVAHSTPFTRGLMTEKKKKRREEEEERNTRQTLRMTRATVAMMSTTPMSENNSGHDQQHHQGREQQ